MNLLSLPNDCLLDIAYFLQTKDFVNFTMVCKSLYFLLFDSFLYKENKKIFLKYRWPIKTLMGKRTNFNARAVALPSWFRNSNEFFIPRNFQTDPSAFQRTQCIIQRKTVQRKTVQKEDKNTNFFQRKKQKPEFVFQKKKKNIYCKNQKRKNQKF